MNVAFHELAGIAIAQETAAWLGTPRAGRIVDRRRRGLVWAGAFVMAALAHGVLDALPHYYPLPPVGDAIVSMALVATWVWIAPPWLRLPLFVTCLGALVPDIIDHVPDDLHKHLHLDIPVPPNFFPWHWNGGSGSLVGRSGPRWAESLTYHAIVVAFCLVAIARTSSVLKRRDR